MAPLLCSLITFFNYSNQFGFIPDFYTTFALISMLHHWFEATDGTGTHVRAALLDYKKAFDLVDHNLLIANSIV